MPLVLVGTVSGCSCSAAKAARNGPLTGEITVFAAASLTERSPLWRSKSRRSTRAIKVSVRLIGYVAKLVGMNLYRGHARTGRIEITGAGLLAASDAPDGPVLVGVRPSAFTVHTEPPHSSSARIVWPGGLRTLGPLADRVRRSVEGDQSVIVDVTASAVVELRLAPATAAAEPPIEAPPDLSLG